MSDISNKDTVLLCGRDFTTQDLWVVTETARRFPKISLTELAHTICENLGWVTPNGRNKIESCIQLLEKLNDEGQIQIPKKQNLNNQKPRRVTPTSQTDAPAAIHCSLSDLEIKVEPVFDQAEMQLWNQYVERYHTLGYKQPFGAHQRYYIISKDGNRLGCLLFSASAWALSARDQWIGWTKDDRSRRLHLVLNNTRFLIFPWVNVKNLASKSLSMAIKRICPDWQERYNYQPVLLETFVDTEKYQGTCYRAANWVYLGETAGRGRMDRYSKKGLSVKTIYVYPLVANFRAHLCGEAGVQDE
jgi:hypothetical protein